MKKVKEYVFSTVLETSYEEAVSKVIEVLKEEGFGILTEIDVKATLKKKLDVDFRKYLILGACNPLYAYRSLQAELDVGLLLPCNVIIYEIEDNKIHVSALNPIAALAVIENKELKKIALEVSDKLKRVIDRVASDRWMGVYKIDPAIQSLIMKLSRSDDTVRIQSRESLVRTGNRAVPQLIETLKHPQHWVRWEAAKALGEIGDPNAAPALTEVLEDDEFDVRWLAAVGLIGMNIKGLKPLLQALMKRGDSTLLREGAHHVIHDLAKGELRKYLVPLKVALEDIEPAVEVPQAAYNALDMLEKEKKVSSYFSESQPKHKSSSDGISNARN
ncbi:MAG: DUF302 domain-containing protein [Syntrophaceae bacterium]|nr:DUF302 domain-containing protein [Syntrophaceae bacterium]